MDPITINVHVQIGVTDNLCGILTTLIGKSVPAAAPQQVAPAQNEAATQKPQVEEPAAQDPQQDPQQEGIIEDAPADLFPLPGEPNYEKVYGTQAAAPEPAPEPEAPQPAKEYTEVEVRAAMDRARQRIEGADYKDNPESEGRKKWHRALTSWFKNQAAFCGAEKPSALPDHQSRAAFIRVCDEVQVENGELTVKCPF